MVTVGNRSRAAATAPGSTVCFERVAQRDLVEFEEVGEPFEQHGRRPFIISRAFVECGEHEARRRASGHAVPLDDDFTGFAGRGESRRDQRRYAFRTRDDDQAAIGHREQPLLGDRAASAQSRHEVEPAEQAIVVHVRGYSPDGGTVRQQ